MNEFRRAISARQSLHSNTGCVFTDHGKFKTS